MNLSKHENAERRLRDASSQLLRTAAIQTESPGCTHGSAQCFSDSKRTKACSLRGIPLYSLAHHNPLLARHVKRQRHWPREVCAGLSREAVAL